MNINARVESYSFSSPHEEFLPKIPPTSDLSSGWQFVGIGLDSCSGHFLLDLVARAVLRGGLRLDRFRRRRACMHPRLMHATIRHAAHMPAAAHRVHRLAHMPHLLLLHVAVRRLVWRENK